MRQLDRFTILLSVSCLLSSLFIGALLVLVLNEGHFSLVHNTLAGIEICICASCVQCMFVFLVTWMYKPGDGAATRNFSLLSQLLSIIKSLGILFVGSLGFHAVAVLFGAPFFVSTAKTYHLAMLLTTHVCLPFCLFLGPHVDAWVKVFVKNSCDDALELVVYFCSIGALLGAWLGAIPIPLDWDRPWQEWPITCVVGSSMGYAGGLLLSSVCIPRLHRASSKFKFF